MKTMPSGRSWPPAGAALLLAAVACVIAIAIAPLLSLGIATVILIAAVGVGRRVGSWRTPVTVAAALAVLLAGTLLLVSFDFGLTGCPGVGCGEQVPVSEVPIPG
jgi:hypothetical protein